MRVELLEKIEGEAFLDMECERGRIQNIYVRFPHYRGIEEILRSRPALDALVINPRICGICGHAHLIATAMVLEKVSGIVPTQKAKKIREITRFCEIVQNHLKWFYLVIFVQLGLPFDMDRVQRIIREINKLLAIFGGQWPHSSYALPGGVTCDPTQLEILQASHIAQSLQREFGLLFGDFDIKNLQKDLKRLFDKLSELDVLHLGKGYDRFIVFGSDGYVQNAKLLHGKIRPARLEYVKEQEQPKSFAKRVTYKGKFYETGPLARTMIRGGTFVKRLHRRYKDSLTTRIFARIYEAAQLLQNIKNNLSTLDLSQESAIEASLQDGKASIAIEAARGSLIHTVEIENQRIKNYSIVTPTQWNLSNGSKDNLSLIQKALVGAPCTHTDLIFRTFDICSVCTTH